MKKIAAIVLLFVYSSSSACTTFLLSKNGRHLFGRNYDWVTGNGIVMVNAKGLSKTSLKEADNKQISWVSAYGSISFNQYGKEFPTGGMNEKGLVVELMWLDETNYPAEDDRPVLGVLQWIQYQLDCAATVDEVINSHSLIRISSSQGVPLHYLVADAAGNAATIEFLKGVMVVHKDKDLPLPVLTNTIYSKALEQTFIKPQNESAAVFKDNSISRFATACSMVERIQKTDGTLPTVDFAFSILENVSQGSFTKWSIVYDISNRAVYFTTNKNKKRRSFSFDQFNFTCSNPSVAYDLSGKEGGNITNQFTKLNFDQNRNLIKQSLKESGSRINASDKAVTETADYFFRPVCN